MKNYFLPVIIVLISFSPEIEAQDNSSTKSNIRLGGIAGINLADIKSNSNQDAKTYLAPAFGIATEFSVIHGLSLKVDLLYLNKGVKLMEGEDPMEEPEAHLKSNYIDMPVLLKYSFLDGISPYLLAGTELGYQLSTKLNVIFPGLEPTLDMTDVTKNFEFGVSFGGGLEIPLNSLNFFFDIKYTLGLTNMQKTGTVTTDVGGVQIPIDYDKDENGYKNRGTQLLIGIAYYFK